MKKFIVLLLMSALLLSACNGEDTATDTAADTTKSATTTVTDDDVTSDETTSTETEITISEDGTTATEAEKITPDEEALYLKEAIEFEKSVDAIAFDDSSYQENIKIIGGKEIENSINVGITRNDDYDNKKSLYIHGTVNNDSVSYKRDLDYIRIYENGKDAMIPYSAEYIADLERRFSDKCFINEETSNSLTKSSESISSDNIYLTYQFDISQDKITHIMGKILPLIDDTLTLDSVTEYTVDSFRCEMLIYKSLNRKTEYTACVINFQNTATFSFKIGETLYNAEYTSTTTRK